MTAACAVRSRRRAIVACCALLAALGTTGPALGGGSTGKLVVEIRPAPQAAGATNVAPPPYRPVTVQLATVARAHAKKPTRARASAPGPAATLSLSIVAGTDALGAQALMAGNWMGLLPLWNDAGATYHVPWQVLAAINKIESNNGTNLGPSTAGALGWMQFMPGTWAYYGVDANGDGRADPNNPLDAITSAARYLAASGAGSNLPRAIFAYNHAWWYVDEVLALARSYGYRGPLS